MAQRWGGPRAEGGWSYGSLIRRGVEAVVDVEGRPIAERRAPPSVRRDVAFVAKACPYPDERAGKPMNVSALAQITRHFDAALDDLVAVRAALSSHPTTWELLLTVVVDQLGAPALHLLRGGSATSVPAAAAVAHKLAAGYFGVVRGALAATDAGAHEQVSPERFADTVRASGALIGASEACAGPPHMIARTTACLVDGRPGAVPVSDTARIEIATLLRRQIQIGLAWERFDLAAEVATLESFTREKPRVAFFARRIAERIQGLPASADRVPAPAEALPTDLDPSIRARLVDALGGAPRATRADAACSAIVDNAAGALLLDGAARARCVAQLALYLDTRSEVLAALALHERAIRVALALPEDEAQATVAFDDTVLPPARTLHWLESALGVRATTTTSEQPTVAIASLPRPTVAMGR
ncbi:MAG: hypothetical protein KC657_21615 [Myxococcales bacterium]|nr:hypothetical protein [Myxococcales bacterium]